LKNPAPQRPQADRDFERSAQRASEQREEPEQSRDAHARVPRGNEGFDVTGAYSGQIGGTYHGKGGTNVQFDGMGIQHSLGNQGYNANAETVQELVLSTSGITADSNADGPL
jgi:hypothetical protein